MLGQLRKALAHAYVRGWYEGSGAIPDAKEKYAAIESVLREYPELASLVGAPDASKPMNGADAA